MDKAFAQVQAEAHPNAVVLSPDSVQPPTATSLAQNAAPQSNTEPSPSSIVPTDKASAADINGRGPAVTPKAMSPAPAPLPDGLDAASQHYIDSQRDAELAYSAKLRQAQREVALMEQEAKAAELKKKIHDNVVPTAPAFAPVVSVEPAGGTKRKDDIPPPPPPPPPTLQNVVGGIASVEYEGLVRQAKTGDNVGPYRVVDVGFGKVLLQQGKKQTELRTSW